MEVKMFGIAREIAGSGLAEVTEALSTVGELRSYLNDNYPELSTIKSYMIAVNQAYAEDSEGLSASDEIAIIPPVSGG